MPDAAVLERRAEAQRRYFASEAGLAARRRVEAAAEERDPEGYRLRTYARQAVYRAIKAGRLVRPAACSSCGVDGRVQAHHHHGYAPEHRLDVVWLCPSCHVAADRQEPDADHP